ncbi:hypothetical protein ElyMa_002903200 [Elysia marginata]|uniref:Uncharacterized protein n=1 Tax=Elysia marginata TaxID=1093978 RepID=A0AAV4I0M7_9GAST|nr:hypothetical protein ElyMa_002903200 [Elysia marginata]
MIITEVYMHPARRQQLDIVEARVTVRSGMLVSPGLAQVKPVLPSFGGQFGQTERRARSLTQHTRGQTGQRLSDKFLSLS